MSERIMNLNVRYYSSVEPQMVSWLWYPYIPFGKVTILQGDPGDGKSTMILDLISRLTTGTELPDGQKIKETINCVYQCSEDNLADTIKPRLLTAGADCSKVAFIDELNESLKLDDERIAKTISETNSKLLVLDPIQSFFSQEADMQSAVRIRNLLKSLARTAENYDCAVVLIGHMNKAEGKKRIYRGLGSIDITATARSVLMLYKDESEPSVRYISHIKSNLAPLGDTLCFSFTSQGKITWLGKCETEPFDYDEDLSDSVEKRELAEKILITYLAGGPVMSSKIMKKIRSYDISERTVHKVKKKLGIISCKKGNVWFWELPEKQEVSANAE